MLILLLPSISFAETHKKVQAALDYKLPENTCKKPKPLPRTTEAVGAPIQNTGSIIAFEGSGADEVSDVDSYTIRRLERKHERYNKCLAEFKGNLLDDMEELKASAQFGLTQSQADTILLNMSGIQKVYMTEDGRLEKTDRKDAD